MTPRKTPSIVDVKGLDRVTFPLKKISKAVEQLQTRSNSPDDKAGLHVLLFSYGLRLQNITSKDLGFTELNSVPVSSTRNYILILHGLAMYGEACRSNIAKILGMDKRTAYKILEQYISAGYVAQFNKSIQKSFTHIKYFESVPYLKLTSKGYDKINHIFSLLIDERLL